MGHVHPGKPLPKLSCHSVNAEANDEGLRQENTNLKQTNAKLVVSIRELKRDNEILRAALKSVYSKRRNIEPALMALKLVSEDDGADESALLDFQSAEHANDSCFQNSSHNNSSHSNCGNAKRQGVSAESKDTAHVDSKASIYYQKEKATREAIRLVIQQNAFLKNINAVQLQECVARMRPVVVQAGDFFVRENEEANSLLICLDGKYEIWHENTLKQCVDGGCYFGDMALLYKCKRNESIKALRSTTIWALDREVYKTVMMQTGQETMRERKAFLSSVPLLRGLGQTQLMRVADMLEAQKYGRGDCILRKDELADSFFIIQSGEVVVSTFNNVGKEVEVRRLKVGEYFGERALLGEGRRTANVYAGTPEVVLLCLYRKDFLELIGNVQELHDKTYDDEQSRIGQNWALQLTGADGRSSTPTNGSSSKQLQPLSSRQNTEFNPDDYVLAAVLGAGYYGRVELVHPVNERNKSFAMKRMVKNHIVKTKQEEHIMNERRILLSADCYFICKLYATAKDSKFLYMLMEVCLGGDLWTKLRNSDRMTDKEVRFSLGCVIEAFDYLHSHGIVYRDLKPENLLISEKGYLKLCDFGFAKYIGVGCKTWTFCGTSEYIAPEVILNNGHDFSADFWSLGILTCELLTGKPPFMGNTNEKIFLQTLRGIHLMELSLSKHLSRKAHQLISQLCQLNPLQRLGVNHAGIQEIRDHKYFQEFDWQSLADRAMSSPFSYEVTDALDIRNFDYFPVENLDPPVENSGWDEGY